MTSSTGKRSSNIELLRILSMFMVLVLHANFLGIGAPTTQDCITAPGNAFLRFFLESLSIGATDVFVLISGWFGIKPSLKKFIALVFQVLFITFSILIIFYIINGRSAISPKSVLRLFMVTKGYWFIKSYLCLYILSPIVNYFAENAPKNMFKLVLMGFFAFQTIYGWTDSAPEFYYGYSTLSFIGLYLLARYLRLYPVRALSNRRLCLITYFASSLFITLAIWGLMKMDFHTDYAILIVFSYINPIIILSSLALLFTFNNIEIPLSKTINWIASSVFAVYIIHTNEFVMGPYRSAVWYLYSSYPVVLRSLLILLFLSLVFISCVFFDKIRLFVWGKLLNAYERRRK